jgi:hypothetical protein
MAQELSDDFINDLISLTEIMTDGLDGMADATLPMGDALRLRRGVGLMARVIRTESERHTQTATLDDAARYLRALWPQGDTLSFYAGDESAQPHVRWSSRDWSGEVVYVASVKSEAPSSDLARIVDRLRAMVEEECNVATDRAARLRAAIGGES